MKQNRIRPSIVAALVWIVCAFGVEHVNAQSPIMGDNAPLRTDLNEAVHLIPVTVTGLHGMKRSGLMIMTDYHPSGPGPFPAVIYSHGRMVSDGDRAMPLRKTEHDIAAFWVRRGFAFFIATRLGYGATGIEPDIEEVGGCNGADYGPGAQVTLTQVVEAIKFAKSRTFVNPNRIVLVGNSAGGLAMIIASGTALPTGVVTLLNFSGGAGGGVKGAGIPCNEPNIRHLIIQAGKTARLPMLWIYARNDKFWGADLPVSWHDAYASTGGHAEFHMLPPVGNDGHAVIDYWGNWRHVADAYLARFGFPVPAAKGAPPPSPFAAIDDISKIPFVGEGGQKGYRGFLGRDLPRAFAISPTGGWAYRGGENAVSEALKACSDTGACMLYAVDDQVVWRPK